MHQDARKALGLSNIRINEFTLSTGTWVTLVMMVLLEFAVILCPPITFAEWTPWGIKQVAKIFPYLEIPQTRKNLGNGLKLVITSLWAIPHLIEIPNNLLPLLRKYNTTSSTARVAFIIATFFCGFPVWTDLTKRGADEERALVEKDKTH
ncbi:hypothetical protein P7C70_g2166, partial [Phenoliferia sp. Uapishka_3]